MRRQRRARRLAVTRHNVDHALWESGLRNQLRQQQCGERSLFRGLQYHRASCGKGRTKLPGGHQQREIPRNDLSDDAHRLAPRIGEELNFLRTTGKRNGVAFDLCCPSRHVAEQINRQRHIGNTRDRQRLAVIEALQLCELLRTRFEQVGQFPDQAPPLGRRHVGPCIALERLARGLHRAVNVLAIALGDLGEHFPGRRVVGWERLAGRRIHELVVDEHRPRLAEELLHAAVHDCGAGCGSHCHPPTAKCVCYVNSPALKCNFVCGQRVASASRPKHPSLIPRKSLSETWGSWVRERNSSEVGPAKWGRYARQTMPNVAFASIKTGLGGPVSSVTAWFAPIVIYFPAAPFRSAAARDVHCWDKWRRTWRSVPSTTSSVSPTPATARSRCMGESSAIPERCSSCACREAILRHSPSLMAVRSLCLLPPADGSKPSPRPCWGALLSA